MFEGLFRGSLSYHDPAPRCREKVYHSQLLSIWLSSVAHVGCAENADIGGLPTA
jgi:hypothetical protein